MICCLGFHTGDIDRCQSLLAWVDELGGCPKHDLLLVADAGVSHKQIQTLADAHKHSWRHVVGITNRFPVRGWIPGSNSLFLESAIWCRRTQQNGWLWMETDCVPVKSGWLDQIEIEYQACGRDYLGHIYPCAAKDLPKQLMSGIAVYPENMYDLAQKIVHNGTAFDVALADTVTPVAAHTKLIKHIWGTPRFPPRFYEKLPVSPLPNSFTKALLGEDCVLFHRVKDDSLINLLRGRPVKPMLRWMVWPFCNKDAHTALKCLAWMGELNRYDWNLVLSYPINTNSTLVHQMRQRARCFASVSETRYEDRVPGWPPNIAFQHAARFMAINVREPWLWMEPDAVPMRAEWLDVIRREYAGCSQNFMGPHVSGMSHCNGTAVYPGDTPQRIPLAMLEKHDAWDTKMAAEMMHDCHDLMPYLFHVWTADRNNFYSCGGGAAPTFPDQRMVDKIPAETVVFHRNKDLSLIDRLRERRKLNP